jgi:hypothetical protein
MNDKKSRLGVTVVLIALTLTILTIMIGATIMQQRVFSITKQITDQRNAPVATSGDNVYVVWWTNKTGNDEVMFRASTDGGKTFGDKINLSNSTNADSQDAQIDASGDRVFVTWWDRNSTSEEPLLRTSTDNGATFGPIMKLGANETIGSSGGG